ncbi:MAG TPA: CsbD family protein [Nakamurella sp.]
MGLEDKISNAAEEAKGKVKEATGKATGKATGDDSLAAEGKGDQASADVKQAAEKVRTPSRTRWTTEELRRRRYRRSRDRSAELLPGAPARHSQQKTWGARSRRRES